MLDRKRMQLCLHDESSENGRLTKGTKISILQRRIDILGIFCASVARKTMFMAA